MNDPETDPYVISIITQFLPGLMVPIIGFSFARFDIISISLPLYVIIWMPISFSLWGGAAYYANKALKFIDASKYIVYNSFGSVITILFSTTFLNERLTLVQSLGVGLILISILIISSKNIKYFLKLDKGDNFALIAAIASGIGLTIDKYIMHFISPLPYLALNFLCTSLILFLFKPRIIKKFKPSLNKKILTQALLQAVFFAIASSSFYIALEKSDNSSLASSIIQVNIILTILLATILFKERTSLLRKVISGILSFLGLILLMG